MAFNFTDIIAAETKKQEEAARTGSGGGIGFKTVYPFANGRLEFRLIGNEPSGLLYRELVFHEYWSDSKKQKVPCLRHMYNMDCPICNAVDNVQATLDDKDIFGKYGFKKQGIMFAKLISVSPDNYFGDTRNPAKAGDIILFMFPKSVINELRNLIVEYSEDLENIFANNTARTVTLKIGTQANGFPEYSFYVKGSNDTLCVDMQGNPDQAAFNEFMMKLPNLKEVKFPASPDENIANVHRTVVEEINRKYFGDMVGTPMPAPTQMAATPTTVSNSTPAYTAPINSAPVAPVNAIENTVPAHNLAPVAASTPVAPVQNVAPTTAPVQSAVDSTPAQETVVAPVNAIATEDSRGQRPPCFGNNEYNDKCAACPWDNECV